MMIQEEDAQDGDVLHGCSAKTTGTKTWYTIQPDMYVAERYSAQLQPDMYAKLSNIYGFVIVASCSSTGSCAGTSLQSLLQLSVKVIFT